MTDSLVETIVSGIFAVALALIALGQAFVISKVHKIHKEVNGHTRLMLQAAKGESVATGRAAGIEQERKDQRDRDSGTRKPGKRP